MQPPSKRVLRPTASQPTTAEHYGRQHGIPEAVQAALQNVGRKGRMAVSQGARTWDRTQSYPSISAHSDPFETPSFPPFITSQQAYAHAERAVRADRADEARRRELAPYALDGRAGPSAASASSSRSPSPPRLPRGARLSFSPDAIDAEGAEAAHAQAGHAGRRAQRWDRALVQAKKRKDGSDTETDGEGEGAEDIDIDAEPTEQSELEPTAHPAGAAQEGGHDDFPPVFDSPQITQPELFAPPGRRVRNMPGRLLGKTVSAPVGVFGRFGRIAAPTRPAAADEMDVEDGFDVGEWAASEEF